MVKGVTTKLKKICTVTSQTQFIHIFVYSATSPSFPSPVLLLIHFHTHTIIQLVLSLNILLLIHSPAKHTSSYKNNQTCTQ